MERAVKLAISREKLVTEVSYAGIFRSITGCEVARIASRSHAYSLLGERERERIGLRGVAWDSIISSC
jgi:hypothetical protein